MLGLCKFFDPRFLSVYFCSSSSVFVYTMFACVISLCVSGRPRRADRLCSLPARPRPQQRRLPRDRRGRGTVRTEAAPTILQEMYAPLLGGHYCV